MINYESKINHNVLDMMINYESKIFKIILFLSYPFYILNQYSKKWNLLELSVLNAISMD